MNNSKKWLTVGIFLGILNFLPIIVYLPSIIQGIFSPDIYTTVPGYPGAPTKTIIDRDFSKSVSMILHAIWTFICLLLSLYVGDYFKNKFKSKGISGVLSAIYASILALLCFILVYVILAIPLIDNRTVEGYQAFINFESISHLIAGILYSIAVVLTTLLA